MTDKLTPEQRSYNMSKISAKDTTPEIMVRHALHHLGYRYRINDKRFPGKPDIYLPKYKTAIFINGCFWHGHKGCKYFKIPKTRAQFWRNKINQTIQRDQRNIDQLSKINIKVITVWECEIMKDLNTVIKNIVAQLG